MDFAFAFDHLVVAARSLNEGTSYVEAILGAKLSPGGKHARMGTHNRLLSLGDDAYLEVIAIDPDAPKPEHRRWFNLDAFSGAPRLTNWACRTDDIESALEAAPAGSGTPMPLKRGDLKWQMAVPDFGRLPFDDAMPALIEWYSDIQPPQMLDDAGFRLSRLDVVHPKAEQLLSDFPALNRLLGTVSVLPGPEKRLVATISTPLGDRILA
ncbi:MAG: VOC family protein [Paracoccaceae bacterium]|uniref:VOC family protein n=1 Tax=Parasphingorhabdus sp. TaxID=2709688 RepID=UPI00328FCB60